MAELLTQWSDCMATEHTTGQSDHLRATEGGGKATTTSQPLHSPQYESKQILSLRPCQCNKVIYLYKSICEVTWTVHNRQMPSRHYPHFQFSRHNDPNYWKIKDKIKTLKIEKRYERMDFARTLISKYILFSANNDQSQHSNATFETIPFLAFQRILCEVHLFNLIIPFKWHI